MDNINFNDVNTALNNLNKMFDKVSNVVNKSEYKDNEKVREAFNDAMTLKKMMQKNEFNNEAINNLKSKYGN